MTSETIRALIVVTATTTVVLSIASMVGILTGGLVTVAALGVMSMTLGLLVFQTFDASCKRSYDA